MHKTAADKNNFKVGADNGWKLAELNVGQAALYAKMIGLPIISNFL
jgi:hypothetical protein